MRTQTVRVLAPTSPSRGRPVGAAWTGRAPVTERGEALGLLEMSRPDEPEPGVLAEIGRSAQALGCVVIANRRHTDLFEWGQRSTLFSLPAEIQRRLLPAAFPGAAGEFTRSAWLAPTDASGGTPATTAWTATSSFGRSPRRWATGSPVPSPRRPAPLAGATPAGAGSGCSNKPRQPTRRWPSTPGAAPTKAPSPGCSAGLISAPAGSNSSTPGTPAPPSTGPGWSAWSTSRSTSRSGSSPTPPTGSRRGCWSPATGSSSSPTACSSATRPASTSRPRSGRCARRTPPGGDPPAGR